MNLAEPWTSTFRNSTRSLARSDWFIFPMYHSHCWITDRSEPTSASLKYVSFLSLWYMVWSTESRPDYCRSMKGFLGHSRTGPFLMSIVRSSACTA
jgi:hypothetical protein